MSERRCKDGKDGTNGERGKRGHRGKCGKEGPQGPQGFKGNSGSTGPSGGPPGATGPTGPCCTGPTGPAGPTGPGGGATGGGIPDYAYTHVEQDQDVPPNGNVAFALTTVAQGITMDPPGLRVLRTGFYEFGFQVRGINSSVPGDAIVFELRQNGFNLSSGTKFKSPALNPSIDPNRNAVVCEGHGLIGLLAGGLVTLGNTSGGGNVGTQPVHIGPATLDATVGATLFLILVQPVP